MQFTFSSSDALLDLFRPPLFCVYSPYQWAYCSNLLTLCHHSLWTSSLLFFLSVMAWWWGFKGFVTQIMPAWCSLWWIVYFCESLCVMKCTPQLLRQSARIKTSSKTSKPYSPNVVLSCLRAGWDLKLIIYSSPLISNMHIYIIFFQNAKQIHGSKYNTTLHFILTHFWGF